MPPDELETARLHLRPPRLNDADAMFDYASDIEVTRFLTFPPATEISFVVEFLERCEQVWLDGSAFPWAITLHGHDELLGTVEARPTIHGVELGYVLRRSSWGNGYMTEAVEAVAEWNLAQEFGLPSVGVCRCSQHRITASPREGGINPRGDPSPLGAPPKRVT